MISTREIGLAVVTLGGGARPEDSFDHWSASPGCSPVGAADGQRREAAYGEHPCIPLRVIIEVFRVFAGFEAKTQRLRALVRRALSKRQS
ncbi:hypothetical protein [Mesorhizobium tianshanense]|uniref:hypothetical protein n=1 Tax=Mesorhizobium tianshanense TaxID=39844 RepID=UPI0011A0D30B|nr:hypothetical protein [Mesorhizobium tianshanense]